MNIYKLKMNYQKIYYDIIQKAQSENRKKLSKKNINYIYYEKHHIIPCCLNGTNDKENLVLLTGREHFICHKLLTYIYKENRKIVCAFHKMSFGNNNIKYNLSSRDYEYAKKLISLTPLSTITKNKIGKAVKERFEKNGCSFETRKKLSVSLKGKPAYNKGKKMSEEQKQKLKKAWENRSRNLPISEATRKKMSESAKNKPPVSEVTRKKMSESRKGEKNGMFGKSAMKGKHHTEESKNKMRKSKPLVMCPYCKKIGGISVMKRFHFENCYFLK